jgi:hypothetical protein
VAGDLSAGALAAAIRVAFELPAERAEDYRRRAGKLLDRYRPKALERLLAERVLPALLP